MFNTLFNVLYWISIIYLLFYFCTYIYLKFIKKDKRLEKIGFYNYIWNTRKILKGDK